MTTDNAAIAANKLGAGLYVVRAGDRTDNRRKRKYAREVIVQMPWPTGHEPEPDAFRAAGIPAPSRSTTWVHQEQRRLSCTWARSYERPSEIEEDRTIEAWAESVLVPALFALREREEATVAAEARASQVARDADAIASYVREQAYEEASQEIRYAERLAELRRERTEARVRALTAGIAEIDALCDRSEREDQRTLSPEAREVARTVLRAQIGRIAQAHDPSDAGLPRSDAGFWREAREAAATMLGVEYHKIVR